MTKRWPPLNRSWYARSLGSLPAAKWSFISDQDGRGCIFTGGRGDTLMLTVFRNPTPDRARELYDTFVKTLGERMPVAPVSGIGDEAQAGEFAEMEIVGAHDYDLVARPVDVPTTIARGVRL